jgi:hypothetical protein
LQGLTTFDVLVTSLPVTLSELSRLSGYSRQWIKKLAMQTGIPWLARDENGDWKVRDSKAASRWASSVSARRTPRVFSKVSRDDFLTSGELAQLTGYSRRHISRLTAIPGAFWRGRQRAFHKSSRLQAWIEQRRSVGRHEATIVRPAAYQHIDRLNAWVMTCDLDEDAPVLDKVEEWVVALLSNIRSRRRTSSRPAEAPIKIPGTGGGAKTQRH